MALAAISALTYSYPESAAPALAGVELAVDGGLTVVAGASGSGKSTLLRLFNGLVPRFHGGRIRGEVRVAGGDPLRDPIGEAARRVGFVFQDPEQQAVYSTVEREVAFGLENLAVAPAEMRQRVEDALAAVGALGLRGRRLETLSGGERQRVAMASALALRPPLLVLDEPTSQLDAAGSAMVAAACVGLAREGRGVVVAEHRLEGLLELAGSLLLVDAGRVDAGPARELSARLPSPPAVVRLSGLLGWRPPALSIEEARGRLPEIAFHAGAGAARGEPVWTLAGVSAGLDGRPVVEAVDLAGGAGEVVVLMGPNGGGKTTLLRTIAGLARPLAGAAEHLPGRVAYLPQNPTALLHRPTLLDEVRLTLDRAGEVEDPLEVLDLVGLAAMAPRYPRDLSSGERQRAALAAVLAGSPRVALLDEPTRGMDLAARRALQALLDRLRDRGCATVLATHDADLAAEVADRVVEVADGRVIELGPPEQALSGASPYATQVGRLFPGGPVTPERVVAAL